MQNFTYFDTAGSLVQLEMVSSTMLADSLAMISITKHTGSNIKFAHPPSTPLKIERISTDETILAVSVCNSEFKERKKLLQPSEPSP